MNQLPLIIKLPIFLIVWLGGIVLLTCGGVLVGHIMRLPFGFVMAFNQIAALTWYGITAYAFWWRRS